MTALRFLLFNIGVRICDVIGGPLDRTLFRLPVLRDHLGACMVLHGITMPRYGEVPDSWWDRFGWGKP